MDIQGGIVLYKIYYVALFFSTINKNSKGISNLSQSNCSPVQQAPVITLSQARSTYLLPRVARCLCEIT